MQRRTNNAITSKKNIFSASGRARGSGVSSKFTLSEDEELAVAEAVVQRRTARPGGGRRNRQPLLRPRLQSGAPRVRRSHSNASAVGLGSRKCLVIRRKRANRYASAAAANCYRRRTHEHWDNRHSRAPVASVAPDCHKNSRTFPLFRF